MRTKLKMVEEGDKPTAYFTCTKQLHKQRHKLTINQPKWHPTKTRRDRNCRSHDRQI